LDIALGLSHQRPYREGTQKENTMDSALQSLRGLRVAVTGGTSGLGLALVDQLKAAGAHVAFVARDAQRVSAVALRRPETHGIVGDVSDKTAIHPLALQLTAALGGVEILINNASTLGPVPLVPLADTECEDFEMALATNLLGPFRLTKALLGALAASARQGRPAIVVNIGSDAGVSAYANWGAYGASKAAVMHMSRTWDEELREHGVRVIAHDPGDMDTPMHAQALPEADPATLKRPGQAARELLERIAQLILQPEQVAA
jgi:NAD(P)-dependent dehydrogenase (short-subunit alcohol dehydrogenase family)